MWKDAAIQPFDHDSLVDLINNRIPAVRIEKFAAKDMADSLVIALLEHACRTQSINQVTRLGISQYEQGLCVTKDNYFRLAKEISNKFSEIYRNSFSPVKQLINLINELGFDTDVMSEPGFGNYFAGNGKLRNGFSPIHVDFAPQDSADWEIGKSKSQLAWNFYLRVPEQGGELLLWDKLWNPQDDVYQVNDSYYYNEEVLKNSPMLQVEVQPGEVLIINSRNYHAVAESEGRLAFGSFISVFENNRLRLWS